MSNLRDLIRLEIERGQLAEPFGVSDLRALVDRNRGLLGGVAAPEHLNSYLANHSTGPGNRVGEAVKRGGARLFIKHKERGTYSLDYASYKGESDDDSEIAEASDAEPFTKELTRAGRRATSGGHSPSGGAPAKDAIAAAFVHYLREKPYRQLVTRGTQLFWGPGPIMGWNSRLNAYRWKGSNWSSTQLTLSKFVSQLAQIESNWSIGSNVTTAIGRIYNDIRLWGNPKGSRFSGAQLVEFLKPLWTAGTIVQVDSTLTKLYAFAKPDTYAIYDSRVAAAIMTIAEDIYRPKTARNRVLHTVEGFRREYPHLGLYNGSGGTRQRGYRAGSGWPNAYRVVAAQMDANDLCRRIRDRLNSLKEDGRSNWTLREVEAVLFMEGY